MSMDVKHCAGCHDNFYNHRGNICGTMCWNLPSARLVKRWRIHRDTPQDKATRFIRVTVPNCYHSPDFGFSAELPEHLR